MRHRNKTNALGRKAAHRKAMLANMASSLIFHKRIKTTVAKAKVLRTYIEPVITKSKNDTTTNRRTAFRYLRDKFAVTELFRNITPKIAERKGGYTRILKLGQRPGDNADICIIELVDFNTTYSPNEKTKTKKRRSRRGGSKKAEVKNEVVVEEKSEQIVEEVKNEDVVEPKKEEVKKEEAAENKVVDTKEEAKGEKNEDTKE